MAVSAAVFGNNVQQGIDRRRPLSPLFFTASSPAPGVVTCRWLDQGFGPGAQNFANPVVVQDWLMYVCPASLAGSPSGVDTTFRFSVLAKGRPIASIRSGHVGADMKLTVSDDELTDVYITIVGLSVDSILGVPAEPVLLFSGVDPVGPLDPVTSPAVNLTAVTDIYGNGFVDLNPSYVAPVVLGRFLGVHVHSVGAYGTSAQNELGNLLIYTRGPGGQAQSGHIILPNDGTASATTLYFVSVDRHGFRQADITTAPSVSVPGGLLA